MSLNLNYRRVYQTLYRNEDLSPENQVRRHMLSESIYDAEGNLVEETLCNDQGHPEQLTRNQYDGNKLAETSITDLLNDFTELQRFTYNQQGQPLETVMVFADGSEMTTTYEYDEQGRVAKRRRIDEEEGTSQLRVYEYEGDFLVAVTETNEEGEVTEAFRYRYNDKGLRVESITEAGEIPGKVSGEFDDQGRLLVQRSYDAEGNLVARSSWEYAGQVVKETSETIQGVTLVESEYDAEGREIARKRSNKEGQILEQLNFAFHPDGRPDRTLGMQYDRSYDVVRFFSLDYEYESKA